MALCDFVFSFFSRVLDPEIKPYSVFILLLIFFAIPLTQPRIIGRY
jgi:hypothetical protein